MLAQRDFTIDELLETTLAQGASDVHLTVGLPPIWRLHGNLVASPYPRLTSELVKKLCYTMLNDRQRDRYEEYRELDCSYACKGLGRFRVNLYRQRGTVAACLRVIPPTLYTREQLHLPVVLEDLVQRRHGLILVTGATGAGKSTTLNCMIDLINTRDNAHIITIEDPIEYVHTHKRCMVQQRELFQDTMSWTAALKATLRQDPDVIMIGEMRDRETVEGALTASETGHLVFSTLHTTGAIESIDRVVDIFPPDQHGQIRVLLSTVVEGIISQVLVSDKTGQGRVPAVEVLLGLPAVRNMIREGKIFGLYNAMETGQKQGMQTMEQSLFMLIQKGLVGADEAMLATQYPEQLQRMMENSRKK